MEESHADHDINDEVAYQRSQTIVSVKSINVGGHQELTGHRIDAALLRMQTTWETHTRAESVLRNVSWN